MAKIDAFFKLMNEQGASDLHLVSGSQPILRVHGDMERIKYKALGNDELKVLLYEIAPENKIKIFALGGISEKNIQKLKLLKIKGFGGINLFKKKPASKRPVFIKNNFF